MLNNDIILYILLWICNFGHCKLHFSPTTQRVTNASKSQYLFSLVPIHFQQYEMSNTCLINISILFAGSVYNVIYFPLGKWVDGYLICTSSKPAHNSSHKRIVWLYIIRYKTHWEITGDGVCGHSIRDFFGKTDTSRGVCTRSVLCWVCCTFWFHLHPSRLLRFTLLGLGKSHDHPCACKSDLKNIGKVIARIQR